MEPAQNKRIIGNKGESVANNFLINTGYTILEKNYRYKRFEIDVIAQRDNILAFVEVKYRTSTEFGFPEEFVSDKQKKQIIKAAEVYLESKRWDKHIRFDIIAINNDKGEIKIQHFKDAFY